MTLVSDPNSTQKGESHMHIRASAFTLLVLLTISGNAFCQTWNQVAHVGRVDSLRASNIEAILVPTPGIYLAATDGGIYRSSDAGSHWSAPWTEGWGVGSLFSHPDGRIFAGAYKGLFVSTDMGVTWSLVPGHPAMMASRMTRDSQGRLFTGIWDFLSSIGGAVYRSTVLRHRFAFMRPLASG